MEKQQNNPSQPAPGKPSFHRRPNEGEKAYAAFKAYCEMGTQRSIRKVARSLTKSVTLIKRWAAQHEWSGRIKDWDADQEARRRKAEDEALKAEAAVWAQRQRQIREQDWRDAQALRAKVAAMLDFPLAKRVVKEGSNEIHIHPAKFTLNNAARMLEVASKLERLAAGLNTEKIEHTGKDDTPIAAGIGQVVIVELPPGRLADDGKEAT